MDKALVQWLNETVTWEQWNGTDTYGQPTYAAGVQVKCFIEGGNKMVRNAKGDTVVSTVTLIFDGTTQAQGFALNDRFTLPSGAKYRPITVDTAYDERGNVWSVEVML